MALAISRVSRPWGRKRARGLLGPRVKGLGFRVWGLGFRGLGLGLSGSKVFDSIIMGAFGAFQV